MAMMQCFMPLSQCRAHGPDDIMDAYLLHAVSHISASAARIKKNNDALKAGQDPEACRDQGFTRAKVGCPAPCAAAQWCDTSCVLQSPYLPYVQRFHRHHVGSENVSETLTCCGML